MIVLRAGARAAAAAQLLLLQSLGALQDHASQFAAKRLVLLLLHVQLLGVELLALLLLLQRLLQFGLLVEHALAAGVGGEDIQAVIAM